MPITDRKRRVSRKPSSGDPNYTCSSKRKLLVVLAVQPINIVIIMPYKILIRLYKRSEVLPQLPCVWFHCMGLSNGLNSLLTATAPHSPNKDIFRLEATVTAPTWTVFTTVPRRTELIRILWVV